MQHNAYPLDTVPLSTLRLCALRQLSHHQHLLPTFDGTAFLCSEISYTIFTAMRDMHEQGIAVTFYELLQWLLGYTVTTFDELDLITHRDVTYAAVDRIFDVQPLKDSPDYCSVLFRRIDSIVEVCHAA